MQVEIIGPLGFLPSSSKSPSLRNSKALLSGRSPSPGLLCANLLRVEGEKIDEAMFPAQIYGVFVRDAECAYRCWGRGSPLAIAKGNAHAQESAGRVSLQSWLPTFSVNTETVQLPFSFPLSESVGPQGW